MSKKRTSNQQTILTCRPCTPCFPAAREDSDMSSSCSLLGQHQVRCPDPDACCLALCFRSIAQKAHHFPICPCFSPSLPPSPSLPLPLSLSPSLPLSLPPSLSLSLSPIQILELLHNSDNSIETIESTERTTSSSNLQTRVNQSPTPGLASLVSGPGDGCCRNRLAYGAGTGGRLRLGRELLAHGHLGCP